MLVRAVLVSLSLSLSPLRRGRVRCATPRRGAPFPVYAVEEALGLSEVRPCSPPFGEAGGVRPTPPELYGPLPGLIAALSLALS